MCGIAGIHLLDAELVGKLNVEAFAAIALQEIDWRGGDATGFAAQHADGSVRVQKAAVRADSFLRHWRGIDNERTRTVLLHTRYATQGAPEWPENNHPVRWGSLHVVHNGSVANDADVFGRTGKVRNGRVDSEAIPAVIAEAGWENAAAGLETLNGSFAIAAVDETRPGELLLARAGWSPLVWVSNGRILAFASTQSALMTAWRKTIGTPPKAKHIVDAPDGSIVRVSGDQIERGEFFPPIPPAPKTAYTYTGPGTTLLNPPTTKAPSAAARPSGSDVTGKTTQLVLTDRVSCSVPPSDVDPRADERRGGWRWGGRGTDYATLERCACCSEWADRDDMEECYGEQVCTDCLAVLLEAVANPTRLYT